MTIVNLTALAETRAKMTPELSVDVWQNTNEGGWAAVGPHHKHDGACDEPGDPAHIKAMADAVGIMATHNAADALIEVARAALRLRAAGSIMAIALRAARTEGNATALATAAAEERLALDSYDAALAKVSP